MATASPGDRNRIGICLFALLLVLGLLALPAPLFAQAVSTSELLRQAKEFEKHHDWLEAWRIYNDILRRDRSREDVRRAYQRCLRCYHVAERHQDKLYRDALEQITPAHALDMYVHVLETIARVYPERQKSSAEALFRQGLEEVRLAFEEPTFRQEYFPGISAETLDSFTKKLDDWQRRKIASRFEARDQVRAIGRLAQQMGFGPRPILLTILTLEFLSGACNALDEYTFFLTPGRYREVQATLHGKLISIGLEVAKNEGQLEITRVYPRSPAWEAHLLPHDRILRIDGQSTENLLAEEAAAMLRGKADSVVEVEVVSMHRMDMLTTLRLTRRAVIVPSVDYELLKEPLIVESGDGMMTAFPIGKMTISYFQESTLQEVKEALASLQSAGMKVLILDLRGNPGGLFKSAVKVAELFLPDGIIVVAHTQLPKDHKMSGPIRAESMSALLMPMVVLIDGETASAAEVLAGALKDNSRAKLVGQTTFGKGLMQRIIPLDKPHFEKMSGGLCITVAKLLSPSWQPFNGKGIQPNISVAPDSEVLLMEARRILLEELFKHLQPMSIPE